MKISIVIIAGYVILTGVIVLMVVFLLRRKADPRTLTRKNYLPALSETSKSSSQMLKDSGDSPDEYDELIERLESLFESEKICLKSEVRISEVASMLATGKGTLSKAIKMKTGKNFCQLVHYYRVREAMRIYANHPKMSIKELSAMVGFKSQTTFITAFGRHTGCTPAEWCRQYRKRIVPGNYGRRKDKKSA